MEATAGPATFCRAVIAATKVLDRYRAAAKIPNAEARTMPNQVPTWLSVARRTREVRNPGSRAMIAQTSAARPRADEQARGKSASWRPPDFRPRKRGSY